MGIALDLAKLEYKRAHAELERLRAVNAELVAALERSQIALDDWLNTYASEMCNKQRIKEARDRIAEYGTIGYIADVQQQNRAALYGIATA